MNRNRRNLRERRSAAERYQAAAITAAQFGKLEPMDAPLAPDIAKSLDARVQ